MQEAKGKHGKRRIVDFLLPFAFCLLTFLFTNPLLLHLGTAVNDPVDPLLNTWILAWNHHALLTAPAGLLNANIFHPYDNTLLYSETLLLPALILLPLRLATGNAILAYNLLLVLGFTTTGFSGYLLGRWLFGKRWAGIALGVVLAFNSYTLSVLPKAQLLQLTWLPLALLYTGRLLRHPDWRKSVMLGCLLAAQFYSVVYYGFFAFLVVALAGGVGWLLHRFARSALRWQALGWLAGGGGLGLLLCLPLAIPYSHLSQAQGLVRTLADAWPFAASLEMWRTPSPTHWLYAQLLPTEQAYVGVYPVEALFPGALLLGVAALGLIRWAYGTRHAWRWSLLLLLGILIFFVLSLGPYWQMQSLTPDFGRTLPYAWLHDWIPGFTALRAPARFAILVFLGLGVAAAACIARLRSAPLQVLLIGLLFTEQLAFPAAGRYEPQFTADQEQAYAWLAAQPAVAYLELPTYSPTFDQEATHWLETQWGSTRHWQRTPTGYSGFLPPHHTDLLLFLWQFPADNVIRLLQALDVRVVLLHMDRLPEEYRRRAQAFAAETPWPVHRWGNLWAVEVPPATEPLLSPQRQIYVPSTAQAGGTLTLSLILTATQPTPVLPNSDLGRLQVAWRQEDTLALTAMVNEQPPFVVDPLAVAAVAVPVPAVAGNYTLHVRAGKDGDLLAEANVSVVDEIAPPEITLLPLFPVSAQILCLEGQPTLRLHLRTVGWYEESVTLSARLLDVQGNEVMRSSADAAFPAYRPRTNLQTVHAYDLPLPALPDQKSAVVEISAYQWQQSAERTVARWFVEADGTVLTTLRLVLPPLKDVPCGP